MKAGSHLSPIYADDFDVEDLDEENGLTCEWCNESGFDELFELI